MHVSESEIESKRSRSGGWSKKQLAEWGVGWPPKKGWKQALIDGTWIPEVIEIKKVDDSEWYRHLINEGCKRIIQVQQGKTIYDGSIENLLR